MKKAIQIGAGNIGRGLNGYILSKNDFHITFLDASKDVVKKLNEVETYEVIQKGENGVTDIVSNFNAFSVIDEKEEASKAIADSELVLISIGIANLKYIKDLLVSAIQIRVEKNIETPLNIVAVENGLNASSVLENIVIPSVNENQMSNIKKSVRFVNCAVDRIVPDQSSSSLDVEVEPFFEVVLDSNVWQGPELKEVKYSETLDMFIQRKLFMLNGTHAFIAWYGIKNDFEYIYEFKDNKNAMQKVEELLSNFVEILNVEFDFTREELQNYSKKIVTRLSNLSIKDNVSRVGRGVKRKVSNADRMVVPIKYAIKHNLKFDHIVEAIAYGFSGLDFDDNEAQEINQYIKDNSLKNAIKHFTELDDNIVKMIEDEVEKI